MKFNVFYRLRGPGGETEAPNTHNPVNADDLGDCLSKMSGNIPNFSNFGVEILGVRVDVLDSSRDSVESIQTS